MEVERVHVADFVDRRGLRVAFKVNPRSLYLLCSDLVAVCDEISVIALVCFVVDWVIVVVPV